MSWLYGNPKFEYEEKFEDLSWPWAGHKYFAYDLIANLKPKVIAELGTHYGTSLWAFSQAVKDQNIDTELNAVDTWEGDKHAGFYGEEVFETVNEIKNKYYSNLKINLIRKTFDEAVKDFEDNSIDILHIDGLHTYEAVKHDFKIWLPKVKDNGIILFHDIVVNRDDFGIYKFWKELREKYKTMEFRHSYGLGILFKSNDNLLLELKEELELHYSYLLEDIENGKMANILDESNKKEQDLLLKNQEIQQNIQDIQLKNQEILQKVQEIEIKEQIIQNEKQETDNLNEIIQQKDINILQKDQEIQLRNNEIQSKSWEIEFMKTSKFWKIKTFYEKLKNPVLKILKSSKKAFLVLKRDGFVVFFKKGFNYFKNKKEFPNYNDYNLWIKQNEDFNISAIKKEINNFKYKPKISIITPVYNVDSKWLDKCIESVVNQFYGNWEFCLHDDASTKKETIKCLKKWERLDSRIKISYGKVNQHISGASNEAIKLATGEFIALLDNDDELAPHALFENIKLLNEHPNADFIYSDEDKLNEDNIRIDPFFKPDWSYYLFLSIMYTCHLGVYRKSIIDKIGGFRKGYEGSQDYDLVLRFIENTIKKNIFHIPKILYHWRIIEGSTAKKSDAKQYAYLNAKKAISDHLQCCDENANVEILNPAGSYRVRRTLADSPKVSIIIPFKDKVKYLKSCIRSIKEKTDYQNYQIILVDNNSVEIETKEYLKSFKNDPSVKIFNYKKVFNFSAINNFAVNLVDSPYLLFLNNDTEVINADWLSSMMEYIIKDDIGVVGAKLYYANNTIQHGGVVMGLGGVAAHAFRKFDRNIHGQFNLTHVIRECSAVTGACLLTKKKLFEELGGFDEKNLAIAYNDVDYCLKVLDSGKLVIFTPFAELYHHESISRGDDESFKFSNPDKYKRFILEQKFIINKWKKYIENDPYYNINLTKDGENFGIKLIN